MKVLTFITCIDQSKGGPSRSVPMFVRGLALEGVDITLMAIKSNDMNLHALDGTSAKIHLIAPNYTRKELEDFVAREKFDIIVFLLFQKLDQVFLHNYLILQNEPTASASQYNLSLHYLQPQHPNLIN